MRPTYSWFALFLLTFASAGIAAPLTFRPMAAPLAPAGLHLIVVKSAPATNARAMTATPRALMRSNSLAGVRPMHFEAPLSYASLIQLVQNNSEIPVDLPASETPTTESLDLLHPVGKLAAIVVLTNAEIVEFNSPPQVSYAAFKAKGLAVIESTLGLASGTTLIFDVVVWQDNGQISVSQILPSFGNPLPPVLLETVGAASGHVLVYAKTTGLPFVFQLQSPDGFAIKSVTITRM